MQEKGVEGKNKIKERFNELAQQVTIDTSEFMNALLKKNQLKKAAEPTEQKQEEENKLDVFIDGMDKNAQGEETAAATEGDTMESTPPMTKSRSEQ